jgi:hypothetical protein
MMIEKKRALVQMGLRFTNFINSLELHNPKQFHSKKRFYRGQSQTVDFLKKQEFVFQIEILK